MVPFELVEDVREDDDGDGGDYEVADDGDPHWDLVFEEEVGPALVVVGDLGDFRGGVVAYRELRLGFPVADLAV